MRWGLIGASTIAAQHMIGAIRNQPGNSIAWVASGTASHAADFAARHGIARSGAALDALLADGAADAVYVSSTNEKHLPQAMAAIAAGCHVLCEKPLAMTLADAAGMVRAADAAGVTFATNHHLRNAGSHHAIRDLIAAGRIGRVLSVRVFHAVHLPPHLQGWRINDAGAGGGVIPDITVHDADTVRFHLAEDPLTVVARMGASGMGRGVEDSCMSVWSMPSGAMVMAHESFTHAHAGTGIEVHGTEGSIRARDVMTQSPVGTLELVTAQGRRDVSYAGHDLYAESVRRFCASVAGDGTPAATGADGVKSLAVALAVRRAAQTGMAQDVDYAGF
jgi:1,5-anhydro-D-fructose reductase (1,5-anhydro-D-mannitol-forming)